MKSGYQDHSTSMEQLDKYARKKLDDLVPRKRFDRCKGSLFPE